MVITEYGVACLNGRSVRERAQALIDIAHPDDRPELVELGKREKMLYQDQIFIAESAHLYPSNITAKHTFKGGVEVHFRAIKPSDEEGMRRLFYRFSDKAVYYRYFSPIKTMPHAKMQEYVNVDYRMAMAIVGLVGESGQERVIAEARFVREPHGPYADMAFVVDEEYQGLGIATYLYKMLIRLAKEQGLPGFTASVLATNQGMMKVLDKGGLPVKASLEQGVYELVIRFDAEPQPDGKRIQYEHKR
jgi:GNAT superfamily N-acetyltransferase